MILTLTGASGAGKTTIAERLIAKLPNAKFLTSFTTRPPRPSDLPGEYAYLSNEDFDGMEERGEFLWTAKVADTRHGTSARSLRDALADEASIFVMILVPEVMKRLFEEAERLKREAIGRGTCLVPFLVRTPPADVLRSRMRERGDEEAKIEARISATIAYEGNARATGIPFIEIENEHSIDRAVEAVLDRLAVTA